MDYAVMAMGKEEFRGSGVEVIVVEGSEDLESTTRDVLGVDWGGGSTVMAIAGWCEKR